MELLNQCQLGIEPCAGYKPGNQFNRWVSADRGPGIGMGGVLQPLDGRAHFGRREDERIDQQGSGAAVGAAGAGHVGARWPKEGGEAINTVRRAARLLAAEGCLNQVVCSPTQMRRV